MRAMGTGLGVVTLLGAAAVVACLSARTSVEAEEGWIADYRDALMLAERTGKPILLTFR